MSWQHHIATPIDPCSSSIICACPFSSSGSDSGSGLPTSLFKFEVKLARGLVEETRLALGLDEEARLALGLDVTLDVPTTVVLVDSPPGVTEPAPKENRLALLEKNEPIPLLHEPMAALAVSATFGVLGRDTGLSTMCCSTSNLDTSTGGVLARELSAVDGALDDVR